MDLRLGKPGSGKPGSGKLGLGPARPGILLRRQEGLRASIYQAVYQGIHQARDQAPQAEAAAARCVERTRPLWSWLAREWRRLGTAVAILLIVGLALHAMFGANGMVIYRQKHAEMQALQGEVNRLQKENNQYADQIRSLKSDPAAIEKEAREQLHYTRPGEVIYFAPDPPPALKPPTSRAQSRPQQ